MCASQDPNLHPYSMCMQDCTEGWLKHSQYCLISELQTHAGTQIAYQSILSKGTMASQFDCVIINVSFSNIGFIINILILGCASSGVTMLCPGVFDLRLRTEREIERVERQQ